MAMISSEDCDSDTRVTCIHDKTGSNTPELSDNTWSVVGR